MQAIVPTTGLPTLLGSVTIDGYTQPGASENTLAKGTNAKPLIEIDGRDVTGIVTLGMSGEGNVVRGLVINDGVIPVAVIGTDNTLAGSFIGTDPTGLHAEAPEQFDVYVGGADGTVGGPTKADRNLISGSPFSGVDVAGDAVSGALIENNLIGTDRTGLAGLGNGFAGVIVRATAEPGVAEVVGNTIAFNGAAPSSAGIVVQPAFIDDEFAYPHGIRIQNNSIFGNAGLGIDLGQDGANTNDPLDADAGVNGRQNTPQIESAKTAGGVTTIAGKLKSAPAKKYRLEFFSNPTGTQATKPIGTVSVVTNAQGGAGFSFSPPTPVAVGERITATATAPDQSTSEISPARLVVAG